jgi:hypothetical protein
MKHRLAGMLALAVVVSLVLTPMVQAQAKQDPKTGLFRIEGSVTAINTDKATITVKEASSVNITWTVAYDKDTAYTVMNADGKLDDVKVGQQVICLGKIPDPEKAKTHLTAVRIEVRKK